MHRFIHKRFFMSSISSSNVDLKYIEEKEQIQFIQKYKQC